MQDERGYRMRCMFCVGECTSWGLWRVVHTQKNLQLPEILLCQLSLCPPSYFHPVSLLSECGQVQRLTFGVANSLQVGRKP